MQGTMAGQFELRRCLYSLEEGLIAPRRAERADIAGLLEVGAHNVDDGHHGRGYAAPHTWPIRAVSELLVFFCSNAKKKR